MYRYKNCSGSAYTFYGVLFPPYEVHEVSGIIPHDKFVITDEPLTESKKETKVEATESKETITPIPILDTEETKRSRKQKGD